MWRGGSAKTRTPENAKCNSRGGPVAIGQPQRASKLHFSPTQPSHPSKEPTNIEPGTDIGSYVFSQSAPCGRSWFRGMHPRHFRMEKRTNRTKLDYTRRTTYISSSISQCTGLKVKEDATDFPWHCGPADVCSHTFPHAERPAPLVTT